MWRETEDLDRMRNKTRDKAIEVEESENSFPGDNDDRGTAEGSLEDFQDCLKETPIMLPLVQPTIPAIYIEGSPYDFTPTTSSSAPHSPECGVFNLSETLGSDWRNSEAGSSEDDRRDSLRSSRSLSVSFGDVTVCELLGGGAAEQSVGGPTASRPILDDLPYINELILSAATPVLGPDNSKGRPKSLGQVLGALPEWLANKRRHGSLSNVSKSSSQDAGDSFSSHRGVGGRQGMKAILTQMRGDHLAPGDYHPRILQPSVSLGAFGAWKDVEHPTLTVSLFFTKNILCRKQRESFRTPCV